MLDEEKDLVVCGGQLCDFLWSSVKYLRESVVCKNGKKLPKHGCSMNNHTEQKEIDHQHLIYNIWNTLLMLYS